MVHTGPRSTIRRTPSARSASSTARDSGLTVSRSDDQPDQPAVDGQQQRCLRCLLQAAYPVVRTPADPDLLLAQ